MEAGCFNSLNMKKIMSVFVCCLVAVGALYGSAAVSPQEFESPADRYHPWAYWWWLNGNVDRRTLTQDLEAMQEMGFRGVIMFDSRGYWEDDNHVRTPAVRYEYLSEPWSDHLVHVVNECARLGLEFSMSFSCSGGSLRGPDKLGSDTPKRLVYQSFALKPGEAVPTFAAPAFEWYSPVAVLAVRYAGEPRKTNLNWRNAGGLYTQVAHHDDRIDADAGEKDAEILEVVDLAQTENWRAADGKWVVLRFGMTTIDGHEYDVDILDKAAVTRYFNRFSKAVLDRVAPHLGKTFTHLYSCSWEGAVPTWSVDFKNDYRELTGDDIIPKLPFLCHFDRKGEREKFVEAYRKARNELFRRNFYLTAKALAAKRGVRWVSESGGPWRRDPAIFGLADQVDFYAVNDLPQGEFWHRMDPEWRNGNGQFVRGAVRAAKELGINRVSAEAFTHMNYHWSVAPCDIKGDGDRAYASGINHFVWHTFTCSPDEYGTPGGEYFAGTHVNRNVPWRRDAAAFIAYLSRCQYLLQQGEPVLRQPPRGEGYIGWGDCDEVFNDSADCKAPKGWRYAHRHCADGTDIYFLTGEGAGEVRFAAKGPAEFWDPMTGKVAPAGEGPVVAVDLPKDGSVFVVFRKDAPKGVPAQRADRSVVTLDGPWAVEFLPPERAVNVTPFTRTLERLADFTTLDDFEVKHFVGTAVYRRTFECPADAKAAALSLGEAKLGIARAILNGRDLGVAWCAPWRVEIPEGVLKPGRNELEIRFTNNWANRLIGDTHLPPEKRVGKTFVAVRDEPRNSSGKKYTVYSGFCRDDALFPCGILGPVRLLE